MALSIFFSFDVEGSEPSLVDNIGFDRVFIEMLMVEHSNMHRTAQCESWDRVRTRLQEANYTQYSNVIRKSDLRMYPNSKCTLKSREFATIREPHIAAGSA